jgi:hypothetical protein
MIKPQAVGMSDRGMIQVMKFWRRGKWSNITSFKWREKAYDKATGSRHER